MSADPIGFDSANRRLLEATSLDLPLDWEHYPADFAEAVEMLRRAKREVAELREARINITTEMVNALAPYLKNWFARPMDYERGAKAIRAVLDAALKGKP